MVNKLTLVRYTEINILDKLPAIILSSWFRRHILHNSIFIYNVVHFDDEYESHDKLRFKFNISIFMN